MKSLMITAIFVAASASAEVFSWKKATTHSGNTLPDNPGWSSFGDADNWATGTDKSGCNSAGRAPGEGDDIYYGASGSDFFCFDLDGSEYIVRNLDNGDMNWVAHRMLVRNGSLTFTGSFTNTWQQVHVFKDGKFTLSPMSSGRFARGGNASLFAVYDGGELDLAGNLQVNKMEVEVESGGEATFRPAMFAFHNTANTAFGKSFVRNSGILNLPDGVRLTGNSGVSPCTFLFEQIAGVMNIGGDFRSEVTADRADFVLNGGVLNVMDDCAFSNFHSVMMNDDSAATVNVEAGKTFDLSKMVFRPGTVMTKTGAGTVKFGNSAPETLNVSEGTVSVAGTAKFGTIAFSSGTTLHIAVGGASAENVIGLDNASVTVEVSVLNSKEPIFTFADSAAAAGFAGKLPPSADGRGYVISGGTVTLEPVGDASVFYWKNESTAAYYSFYDATNWGIGKTLNSENIDGRIPGESDEIYYGNAYHRYLSLDMKKGYRKIKGLCDGISPAQEKYGFFHLGVKNGTIEFVSSFTNGRAYVVADVGGKFVLGDNCCTKMGHGGMQNTYTVNNDGECVIGGMVDMHIMQSTVNPGGKFVFNPSRFTFASDVAYNNVKSYIHNSGTLEIPNGFTLGGASKGDCTFTVEQRGGELLLGGDIVMTDTVDYLDFKLSSGTVRVLNDVAFVGCRTVAMLGGAAAEIAVAEEKTADFSTMTFETDTSVVKTGPGSLKLGASVPSSLAVNSGRLVVGAAADYGSALTLGEGATLHFAAAGASFASLAGLNAASVTFDESALKPGAVLFTTSDAELAAAMAAKILPLVESFSGDRRTLVAAEDGNSRTAFKVVSKRGLKVIVK